MGDLGGPERAQKKREEGTRIIKKNPKSTGRQAGRHDTSLLPLAARGRHALYQACNEQG